MSVEDSFRQRAKDVSDYLRSLKSLEQVHSQPGRGFYRAARAITASRASAFIMIYNCIEYGAREALVMLRRDIMSNGQKFSVLKDYWREEITRAHFRDRLTQGTNYEKFIRDLANFSPGVVDWKADIQKLPFPGNIDNEELLKFIKRIEARWRPPHNSLGGSDLVLIRQMRNSLAHGLEAFDTVGAQFSTQDIVDKFNRIRKFMISLIRTLERYRSQQLYVRKSETSSSQSQ